MINHMGAPLQNKLTQAERTEISDQRMFDAVVRLMVEKGPAATNLKDVGIEAGYSRGLASHRFGSKDSMFAFALRRLGDMWLTQLKAATTGSVGITAIERAVEQHYRFCVDAPDYVRTFYTLWFESVNAGSELNTMIKNIHQRRHQDLVQWIMSDPSIANSVKLKADQIAAQFCATIIGIVYFWLANPDDISETKSLHQNLKLNMIEKLDRVLK